MFFRRFFRLFFFWHCRQSCPSDYFLQSYQTPSWSILTSYASITRLSLGVWGVWLRQVDVRRRFLNSFFFFFFFFFFCYCQLLHINYSAFNFFSQTLFKPFKKIGFSLDLSQIFRKDSWYHPLTLNLFFGVVIFKIRAEFRFFSSLPWERFLYNYFFTNNTLVSRSICLKFSGKTPGTNV